ncbi:MAG: hypothetical protein R3183_08290 [Oleiphilaceae bacterium]|nr:hypothetical protein [Oleiphilaceae bacterium]
MTQSQPSTLDELLDAFKQSVLDKDWEALGQVDQQLRTLLSEQLARCDTEEQKRDMAALLRRLQKVYALAERNARENYQEIATELSKLKQDRRAVRAYEQGQDLT